MGILPSRMQLADEPTGLGRKIERKATPTVAEKQKYAANAFEINDHQPDGTVKPTMLMGFFQECRFVESDLTTALERFHAELDERAGIKPPETATAMQLLRQAMTTRELAFNREVSDLQNKIMRNMLDAMSVAPLEPLPPSQPFSWADSVNRDYPEPWEIWAFKPKEDKRPALADMTEQAWMEHVKAATRTRQT